jgi:hypothetical protein
MLRVRDLVGAYASLLERLYAARAEREVSQDEESRYAAVLVDLWYRLNVRQRHEVEALGEMHNRRASRISAALIDRLYRDRAERGPLTMAEESERAGELEALYGQLRVSERRALEARVEGHKQALRKNAGNFPPNTARGPRVGIERPMTPRARPNVPPAKEPIAIDLDDPRNAHLRDAFVSPKFISPEEGRALEQRLRGQSNASQPKR